MLSLFFQQPLIFFAWAVAFLVALSVHEFSHALVGTLLGDSTAKRMGRLTLNPASHVDPLGLLAVMLIGFGWGRPVPYNPYNLTWQKWGPVMIAFAGPLSNFLLALLSILALMTLGSSYGAGNLLVIFLSICAQLNVALMVFNLIPLPPLDGSKAIFALLAHPRFDALRMMIETKGSNMLLLLVIVDAMFGLGIFAGLVSWAMRLVASIASLPLIL